MLDRQFGVDQICILPLGRIYANDSSWGDRKFVEPSNLFFLPKGMELTILANSLFCAQDTNFIDIMLATIEKNIELNIRTLTTVTTIGATAAWALIRQVHASGNKP